MKPDAMARLLPAVYQEALHADDLRGSPRSVLGVLLGLIAEMHDSTESFLADPARLVDPYRVSDRFLPWLARQVGLAAYLEQSSALHSDTDALRELVRRAASLARRRGTAEALLEMCELVTGVKGFSIDEAVLGEDGRPMPFHFRVVAPAAARSKRAIVETIVATEKPCFVTAEVVFAEAAPAEDSLPTTEDEHV